MSDELENSVREIERLEHELAAARRRRDAEVARIALASSERQAAARSELAPSYVHRLVVAARAGELEAPAVERAPARRAELEHERQARERAEVEPPAARVHVEAEPEIPRLEPEPEPEPPAERELTPEPPREPEREPEPERKAPASGSALARARARAAPPAPGTFTLDEIFSGRR